MELTRQIAIGCRLSTERNLKKRWQLETNRFSAPGTMLNEVDQVAYPCLTPSMIFSTTPQQQV
jgi:hypothetical protein